MPLILIADDDPLVTQLVSHRLKTHGFNVVTVEDGRKALEAAYDMRPNLIVLDAMMPELDGFAVLKELKANRETKNILILMLTALSDEKNVVGALDAGADDYLVKPFIPDELISRVNRLLKKTA
jgi:DNA-binding response OmpR family regulator